jgi:hypothetical protein
MCRVVWDLQPHAQDGSGTVVILCKYIWLLNARSHVLDPVQINFVPPILKTAEVMVCSG